MSPDFALWRLKRQFRRSPMGRWLYRLARARSERRRGQQFLA